MKHAAWAMKGSFYLNMDTSFETMQKTVKYFMVNDKNMEMWKLIGLPITFKIRFMLLMSSGMQ